MSFDPYYKWLGIPPGESAGGPNHYRLLGLSPFEQNTDAIDNAADRQMAHVRTFQTGPQGADSQRLLNEIATARLVLLNPARRREYDERLRAQLAPPPMIVEVPTSPPPEPPSVLVIPSSAPAVNVQPREGAAPARPPQKDVTVEILKTIGGGIAGVVLATVLLRLVFGMDMTGLFPVDEPKQPPAVVQKPQPVEKQKSPLEKQEKVTIATGGEKVAIVTPLTEEMEEYVEPTPSGPVKKKKKKGKNKQPPIQVEPPVDNSPPAVANPPVPEPSPPVSAPVQPAESLAHIKVSSNSLLPRRLPAPADADQKAAEQALESLYQLSKLDEDAKKRTVAAELLALGLTRSTPPAERWAALKAAADQAADAGDAKPVSEGLDAIAQAFEANLLAEEASLLAKAARGARTVEQLKALVEASRVTIQVALANHEYILARDLASAVRNASDRPAGQPFRKFIFDGQREIVRQQEAWYAYREALTKLEASPDDAEANLMAAKWWILARGDWDAALPYLAKSGRPLVKTAAQLDQAKGRDALAIANAWYDAGIAEPVTALWLARARGWYALIDKTQISGLDGAHIDRRLEELAKNEQLVPAAAPIALGRGAARLHPSLAPVVRRHCILAMPFERADHFHDGKSFIICDRSGQANHGTLSGVKAVAGQAGMALEFGGPEHFVECPDQPSLNPTGAITVCAWIRPASWFNTDNAWDYIVSKDDWQQGGARGYVLRAGRGALLNFSLGLGSHWSAGHNADGGTSRLELGQWTHVAAVFDGQQVVKLVNGVEQESTPCSQPIAPSGVALRIGRGAFDSNRRWVGDIDEVAVFDMALTAADLQAIIDLGRAGKPLAE